MESPDVLLDRLCESLEQYFASPSAESQGPQRALDIVCQALGAQAVTWVSPAPMGAYGLRKLSETRWRFGVGGGALEGEGGSPATSTDVTLLESLARPFALAFRPRPNRRLEATQDLAHVGTWEEHVGTDGAQWSPRLCALCGLPSEPTTLTRAQALATVHPDDRSQVLDCLERLSTEVGSLGWKHRVLLPSGRVRHLQSVAECIADASGQPALITGVARDVTPEVEARAHTEEALERAGRYQALFELSLSLPALMDKECRFTEVPSAWGIQLGWSVHPTPGQRLLDVFLEADREQVAQELLKCQEGHGAAFVARVRDEAGHMRWLSCSVTPDGDAGLVYFVGHDISQLKETEAKLRQNEAFLRQTGQLASVGGWAWEVGPRRLYCSDAIAEACGLPSGDDVDFDKVMQRLSKEDRERTTNAARRCIIVGEPFDLELQLSLPDSAESRWVRLLGRAERDHGRTVRLFGACQDVTEQRRVRDEALSASRAKSQFLANMSHEIRTPLNGVLGMTRLLLDSAVTHEQREYLEAVALSGNNLLVIVNDVLDISKIEAGKLDVESLPYSLRNVTVAASRAQARRAHEKGLELVVDVHPEVPPRLLGDSGRVGQVITNLIGNAIKFTSQGGVYVRVEPEGEMLRLSVRDTGIGIAPHRQAAIFDPFTQADGSTTRRFGGTGLGLTICRELVRLMGGNITLVSAPDQGSTFTVRLPRNAAPFAEVPPLKA